MKIETKKKFSCRGIDCLYVALFNGFAPDELLAELPELAPFSKEILAPGQKETSLLVKRDGRVLRLITARAGSPKNPDQARALAARIMETLLRTRVGRAGLLLFSPKSLPAEFPANLVDYLLLNAYRFERYRKKKEKAPGLLRLFANRALKLSAEDLQAARAVDNAVSLVRDLVNEPAAVINPDSFSDLLAEKAAAAGLECRVLRLAELESEKLNGLIAVGAGSPREPALVRLAWRPPAGKHSLALVGKGITFDSGGLNLKGGNYMSDMKSDMAGAAVVGAAVLAAAALQLPVNITAWIALAENLPGRNPLKPGDIITYRNGKTVEIVNTDAEGRLVLADALILAAEEKPDYMVELSTLTGVMDAALGDLWAGLMTGHERLAAGLLAAGERSGERLCRLPLPHEYRKAIESGIADLKNADYRGASAIKAALFLAEFCGRTPFAHIDIAGTALLSRANSYFNSPGASGFGLRLLVEFLRRLGSSG